MRAFTALRLFVTAALLSVSAILGAQAQQVVSRVTERIDSSNMATLHSGVHPLARAEFDRGEVSGDTRTDRVQLILARSSTQENALRTLLEQQQDASSLAYHQWLTPTAFGSAYGPSDADIATLTAWLAAQGFSAIHVNHGRTVVEFSGTAAQMKSAFHVSLHHYLVQGVTYTANAAEPQVPAALVPIVAGFGSLNNFPRHADNVPAGTVRRDRTTGAYTKLTSSSLFAAPAAAAEADSGPLPDFTFTENKVTSYGITPYDFATIYDVLPLWNASTPIDGTGQVIAITGRTDLNPVDFINFRNIFGLPTGAAATTTGSSYLNIIYNGPNPGINGDEPEADIDTQWSGAVAKGATIDFVTSADTVTSYGIDLSAQYIVDNNLAPVMSTSYGACELSMGTAYNLEYLQLWEQASAQGITAVVSAGDAGNAGCEQDQSTPSTVGTAISGFQSTPFNISVGGTDFNIAQGATKYFSSTNSTTTQASALSYIPEVPWNDSCTNFQISLFPPWTGLTAEQVCNTSTARSDGLDSIGGGSGGPSSCISSSGYSSASCTGGYAKPSWQAGVGVPADGVRDTPDVALFASNGFWGAFYLVCNQDSSLNGTCDVNAPYEDFAGYGGTSVAAPAFAGMMALVNQKTGVRQGNANYILYKLYNNQVTAATACNSNSSPASGCIFNDVAIGTISQPCYSYALNCAFTTTTDQVGTLKGGAATTGYDTANGLGSVNAANLVNGWSAATTTSTTTKLTLSPTTFVHGTAVTAGVTVASASGTPLGDVSILGSTTNGTATYGTLAGGAYNTTLDVAPAGAQSGLNANTLPGGSYNVTAHYGGSSLYAESDSAPVAVTVTPEASKVSVTPEEYNFQTGAVTAVNGGTAPYGTPNFIGFKVAGVSGQGFPTGTLAITDSAGVYDGGVALKLNSNGGVDDQSPSLTPGTHTLTASYSGDASFNKSTSTSATFTITKAATTGQLYTASSTGTTSGTVTLEVLVYTTSYGYAAPTGSVVFTSGTTSLGSTTLAQDTNSYYNESFAELVVPASLLPAGTDSITAAYAGDTNYGLSTATGSVSLSTGSLVASTTALTVTPTTYVTGGSFSFTATVTPAVPTPTGNVTLYIGGADYGTFALTAGTITVGGVPSGLVTGANSVYVVYSGDTRYAASTSNTVSLAVVQQGFTLIAPQTAATVSTPGATSSASILAIVPVTGLSGNLNVSFACTSGLPSLATCTFSPASVSIGPSSATTSLTIITKATVASLTPLRFMLYGTAPIALAGLGFFFVPGLRRRRFGSLLGLCFVLAAISALGGCGGSSTPASGSTTTTPMSPGTPTGTYVVVVTATSGSGATAVSSSASINLVVN